MINRRAAFHSDSALEYKIEYFKVIDTSLAELTSRLNQEGLRIYEQLESCLLTGETNDTCLEYPEIDITILKIQLSMFRMQFKYNSTDEAAAELRSSAPEVRRLFNQVEILLRLLIVVPATTCEAERSFSGLRRLKRWLRSTMKQDIDTPIIISLHNALNVLVQ